MPTWTGWLPMKLLTGLWPSGCMSTVASPHLSMSKVRPVHEGW